MLAGLGWIVLPIVVPPLLVSLQVAGESDPLLLGGITEALIFSLKQTISDLCFESA